MGPALQEHDRRRHHQRSEALLIGVDDGDRSVLLERLVGVVRVGQAEGHLAGRHEPLHLPVRARHAHAVGPEVLEKGPRPLVAPGGEQRRNVHRGGAEERICDGGIAAPVRVREVDDRAGHRIRIDPAGVDEQDACAGPDPRPGPVGRLECGRDRGRVRRQVGLHQPSLDEQEWAHGIARPEDVRVRTRCLRDEPVHLGIEDSADGEAGLLLALAEDRLREDLVDRGVGDNLVSRPAAREADDENEDRTPPGVGPRHARTSPSAPAPPRPPRR